MLLSTFSEVTGLTQQGGPNDLLALIALNHHQAVIITGENFMIEKKKRRIAPVNTSIIEGLKGSKMCHWKSESMLVLK